MPRSTRQKSSSKHGSSREMMDYSDSEKESGLKDRKGSCKEESSLSVLKISKEVGSSEKRKLTDLKDNKNNSIRNGDYIEGYTSSSKKKRDKVEEEGGDRWTGGVVDEDERRDGMKKFGKEKESKSRRREEIVDEDPDSLVRKISIGKSEGKHKDSFGRKEGRDTRLEKDKETNRERERMGKEGRSDKFREGDDSRLEKSGGDKAEHQLDRKLKKKKDLAFSDKHSDSFADSYEEVSKNGRSKEGKQRNKSHDDDKQHEDRCTRDKFSRSDDKYIGDEKEAARLKKQRHYDRERVYDVGRDNDYDREHDRIHEQSKGKDIDGNRYGNDDDRDLDWDYSQERTIGRRRSHDQGGDHEKDRLNGSYVDNNGQFGEGRSSRSKDSRGRRRSPDDFEDYNVSKSRSRKTLYDNDTWKRSSGGDLDSDSMKPHSTHPSAEKNCKNSKWNRSPSAENLHGSQEDIRKLRPEGAELRESQVIAKKNFGFSREATDVDDLMEKDSNQRSGKEKRCQVDGFHLKEMSNEGTSGSKASPTSLAERSPSSNQERRHSSRSSRRNLESGESGRRGTPLTSGPIDEKPNREFIDRSCLDDASQSHSGMIPPAAYRGSPSYIGGAEEDSRSSSGGRHKRVGDHLRAQGNVWRGPPNWHSPMPNGFIPFQHGPPHGQFQPMMPQFPPLFNVRPPLDINHSGMPYHFRPMEWQNLMDGTAPQTWEANNGIFQDEHHLFGAPDWDQKMNLMDGRGWDSNAEMWKSGADDVDMEIQPVLDNITDAASLPVLDRRNLDRDEKESNQSASETLHEMTADQHNKTKVPHFCKSYLSKLDISVQLCCPKLYDQFTTLLNIDASSTRDDEDIPRVSLEKSVARNPCGADLFGSSFLPVCDDMLSRKALDFYKKHRVALNSVENSQCGTVEQVLDLDGVGQIKEALAIDTAQENDQILSEIGQVKPEALSSTNDDEQKKAEALSFAIDGEQEKPEALSFATDGEQEKLEALSSAIEKPEALSSVSDGEQEKPEALASAFNGEQEQPEALASVIDIEQEKSEAVASVVNGEQEKLEALASVIDIEQEKPEALASVVNGEQEKPEALASVIDIEQEKPEALASAVNSKQEKPEALATVIDIEQEKPEALSSATDGEREKPEAFSSPAVDSKQEKSLSFAPTVKDIENDPIEPRKNDETKDFVLKLGSELIMNSETNALSLYKGVNAAGDVTDSGYVSDQTQTCDDPHLDAETVELRNLPVTSGDRQEFLVLAEDPDKASDALMASLNESESKILSRIHHSSESTR